MSSKTAIEPPVSKSNWTIKPKTRDAMTLHDMYGRKVGLVYRVGEFGINGGSGPEDVGKIILDAVNANRETVAAPKGDNPSPTLTRLRQQCDELGIKWTHKQNEGRLEQLIENHHSPDARAARANPMPRPKAGDKRWNRKKSEGDEEQERIAREVGIEKDIEVAA